MSIWLWESFSSSAVLSISCLLNFTHSQTKALSSSVFHVISFFWIVIIFLFSLILAPKRVLIIQLCVLLRQFFFFYSQSFSFPSAPLWPACVYSPHLAKHWWRENLGLEISESANISYTELLPALPICILQFSVPWWPEQLGYFQVLAVSLHCTDWPLKVLSPNNSRI